MNYVLLDKLKQKNRIDILRRRPWSDKMCEVACQINLLSVLIVAISGIGLLTKIFPTTNRVQSFMLCTALAGLASVALFNHARKTELAAIVFYIALNLISLVTFELFPAQPLETVLMYILLLSLIVVVFQTLATRLICMTIVLIRITLFGINARFIDPSTTLITYASNPTTRLIYDAMLLGLIALVFVLYGWKLYTIETRNQQKTLFGQHMSHDLQVSFQSLASTIGLLKYNQETKYKIDPILIDELADASTFFSYILGNFLDFSRKDNGNIESNHYEQLDLASELEKLVDLYKYMAEEKGIQIDLNIDDRLPSIILSDKIKVIRIVLNLLTNAINHTKPGKKIDLSVQWNDNGWELMVSNEGEGINEEDMGKLFLAFDEIGQLNKEKRLGLGLPITKQLVDALGGCISASSEQGKSTIFKVAFPPA